MSQKNQLISGESKTTITLNGPVSFNEKEIGDLLAYGRSFVVVDGRIGKVQFGADVIKAAWVGIQYAFANLNLPPYQKEKTFYETLNDKNRRRSWRR